MGVKGKNLVYLTASNWKIVAASCTSIGFRQLLRGSWSLNSWPSLSRNSFFCCFRLKNGNVGSASRPRPLTPPLPVPYPPPTRPKHEHETTRWNFRISFDNIVAETRFKDLFFWKLKQCKINCFRVSRKLHRWISVLWSSKSCFSFVWLASRSGNFALWGFEFCKL